MKRFAAVLAGAWVTVVVSASTALAADGNYPPVPGGGTSVEGSSGGNGTAFTGGDVNVAMIAIAVLLAIGVVALLIARRRAARLAS